MVSPTCLAHLRMVPSVTVSPSWGIETVVATVRLLSVQGPAGRRDQCLTYRFRKRRVGVDEGRRLRRQRLPADHVHQLVDHLARLRPDDAGADDRAVPGGEDLHVTLVLPDDHGPAHAVEEVLRGRDLDPAAGRLLFPDADL